MINFPSHLKETFKFHSLSCGDEIDRDSTNQCNIDFKFLSLMRKQRSTTRAFTP